MHSIEKHTGSLGTRNKLRMQIKTFKYADDMHKFLNKQTDNNWRESVKGLQSGNYAHFAGGWHNVKKLDSFTLAHC